VNPFKFLDESQTAQSKFTGASVEDSVTPVCITLAQRQHVMHRQ